MDKYFDEHLKRLRTDYIDYYLMHMLNDVSAWEKLKALGIEDWLKEKGYDVSLDEVDSAIEAAVKEMNIAMGAAKK